MKQSGRNIKRRLYGLTLLRNRVSRIKHFRGHGVHSPFVYSLVRKVFMGENSEEGELYHALISVGVPKKRAIQLQRLVTFCSVESWSIDNPTNNSQLSILTADCENGTLFEAFNSAKSNGSILVVMQPYLDRERRECCRALIEQHTSTTVDNRGYIIFFNNHLPKQHYRL